MKKLVRKLAMSLCSLALCIVLVGGPTNTIASDAATTRTKNVSVSSPQVRGTYDAYLMDGSTGKSVKVGTSKLSFWNITLSSKVNVTINKSGKVYVLLKYKSVGGGQAKTNTVNIISEQQLKTGFNTFKVTVNSAGTAKLTLGL